MSIYSAKNRIADKGEGRLLPMAQLVGFYCWFYFGSGIAASNVEMFLFFSTES